MIGPFRYFDGSPEMTHLRVMTYMRYPPLLRSAEGFKFERGIDIYRKTMQLWWSRFGPLAAAVHAAIYKNVNQDRAAASAEWHESMA